MNKAQSALGSKASSGWASNYPARGYSGRDSNNGPPKFSRGTDEGSTREGMGGFFIKGREGVGFKKEEQSETQSTGGNWKEQEDSKEESGEEMEYDDNGDDTSIFYDLPKRVQEKLTRAGIEKLFKVQEDTYLPFVEGRELIVKSKTGSGKTLAFLLPLTTLLEERSGPRLRALILEPTRELAQQVDQQIKKFTHLGSIAIYGGVSYNFQTSALESEQLDVIVCTPGRTVDLIEKGALDLSAIKYVILDEGDEMLKMGFQDELSNIYSKISDKARSMIFSATIPAFIKDLSRKYQTNPLVVDLAGTDDKAPAEITHYAMCIQNEKQKQEALIELITQNLDKKILVFTQTKLAAAKLPDLLPFKIKNKTVVLTGDVDQNSRLSRLKQFKHGEKTILIATDVAARGIDVPDIEIVVQTECIKVEAFVHRSGRTGRAGKKGANYFFFENGDWEFVKEVERATGRSVRIKNFFNKSVDEEHEDKMVDDMKREILSNKHARTNLTQKNEKNLDELVKHILEAENKSDILKNLLKKHLIESGHIDVDVSLLTGRIGMKTLQIEALEGESKLDFANLKSFISGRFGAEKESMFEYTNGKALLCDIRVDRVEEFVPALEKALPVKVNVNIEEVSSTEIIKRGFGGFSDFRDRNQTSSFRGSRGGGGFRGGFDRKYDNKGYDSGKGGYDRGYDKGFRRNDNDQYGGYQKAAFSDKEGGNYKSDKGSSWGNRGKWE